MSASLRAGIDAAGSAAALAIVLGDQPLISTEAITRVVTARGDAAAVRATYDGVPGHPVLLKRELFLRARELRGDTGARALLSGVSVREVACDDLGSPDDVDTPEQLAQLGGKRDRHQCARFPHEVTRLVVDIAHPYEDFRRRYEEAVPALNQQQLDALIDRAASWEKVIVPMCCLRLPG